MQIKERATSIPQCSAREGSTSPERPAKSHAEDKMPEGELFDLEVLVPVHPEGRWRERLEMFRHFGLLNIGQARVRVVLLAGTFAVSAQGWDEVEQVIVLNGESNHPARKIYSAYRAMRPRDIRSARWFLRVDDDSATDVGGLLAHLDASCSWREPHHLAGHLCSDVHPAYEAMLREVGAEHLLSPDGQALAGHEWEVSVTSQAALMRALSYPQARELLSLAADYQGGFGDQCLALCCRLAGLFPASVPFLSPFEHLDQFSLWGGSLFHIHYLRQDNPRLWASFMNRVYQYDIQRPSKNSQGTPHSMN